jgi:hypothetical protein
MEELGENMRHRYGRQYASKSVLRSIINSRENHTRVLGHFQRWQNELLFSQLEVRLRNPNPQSTEVRLLWDMWIIDCVANLWTCFADIERFWKTEENDD